MEVLRVILSQDDASQTDAVIALGKLGQSFLVRLFHKKGRDRLTFDLADNGKVIVRWVKDSDHLVVEVLS